MSDYEYARLSDRLRSHELSAEDHVQEAERILAGVHSLEGWKKPSESDLARAQVHAAIAAARVAIEARAAILAEVPEIRPAAPR